MKQADESIKGSLFVLPEDIWRKCPSEASPTRLRNRGATGGVSRVMTRRICLAVLVAVEALAAVGCSILRGPECGSGAIDHGNGWREIGGPTAFLLYDPPYFGPVLARMSWVRIAVPGDARQLSVQVREQNGPGVGQGLIQPEGRPAGAFDPEARPIDDLPGSMYFMMLDIPSPGCWALEFRIGDEVAGRATIPVLPLPTDQAP